MPMSPARGDAASRTGLLPPTTSWWLVGALAITILSQHTGCSVGTFVQDREEIIGTYFLRRPEGTVERLELRENGTFAQHFVGTDGTARTNDGKWTFRKADGYNAIDLSNWVRFRADGGSPSGSIATQPRVVGGKVRITVDPDFDIEYVHE